MNPFKFFSKSKKEATELPILQKIENTLAQVIDPYTQKDWITSKAVKTLEFTEGQVLVGLELSYPARSQHAIFTDMIRKALLTLSGVSSVQVDIQTKIIARKVQPGVKLLSNIKNIIAVASGKGGVGKSTTAVNLALALAKEGAQVGILDADIYGPSQPLMMGVADQRPDSPDNKHITPLKNYSVQVMSMGFLIDPDQPMVWRGPMVTQALQQLLNDTLWDDLDYLVIDLPPGTGDIQLTLSQKIPVTGAVIVTTPQDIALLDARKGLKMFEKVGVPVLGVVENMSTHICSQCGHIEPIFGSGGGQKMSEDFDVTLLGQLPLALAIRESTDSGKPTVVAEPDSEITQLYMAIARQVAAKISEKSRDFSTAFPKIVIQNT
jgi:ATP-binding protein involved in chromosome partitioning